MPTENLQCKPGMNMFFNPIYSYKNIAGWILNRILKSTKNEIDMTRIVPPLPLAAQFVHESFR